MHWNVLVRHRTCKAVLFFYWHQTGWGDQNRARQSARTGCLKFSFSQFWQNMVHRSLLYLNMGPEDQSNGSHKSKHIIIFVYLVHFVSHFTGKCSPRYSLICHCLILATELLPVSFFRFPIISQESFVTKTTIYRMNRYILHLCTGNAAVIKIGNLDYTWMGLCEAETIKKAKKADERWILSNFN